MTTTEQTTEPLLADPAIVSANVAKAWEAVCDMETPVSDVERIGTLIYMAGSDIDDQKQQAAIHWLATSLQALYGKIEESRGEAFHALHNCQPTMPPVITEYVAAAVAYDKAWEARKGTDDKELERTHDHALERLEKAEAVIVKKQVQTEWDAFGRMLVLARISLGGSGINDEDWQNFGREWADALGAPEAIAAMEKVG